MRMFLISDNVDTQMGFRLAGIEGLVVHDLESFQAALKPVLQDENVGIILLTSVVYDFDRDYLNQLKLSHTRQLLVEISDRHQSHDVSSMIAETLKHITGGIS